MPPDDPGQGRPRRYSDKEVSRLLKHATDLQEGDEAGRRADEGGGMTLAALQEVAAEVGIEARYIQLAAGRMDSPDSSRLTRALAGTPLRIRAERIIPGELLDADYEQIAAEIHSVADAPGDASMVGRTLTWKTGSLLADVPLKVTVTSRNGETKILAEEDIHGCAAGIYAGVVFVGLGVGFGVGLGALGSALFATLFPCALIGGLYVAMRPVMKSIGRKRRVKLEALADQIAAYVRPSQPALEGSERPALPGRSGGAP